MGSKTNAYNVKMSLHIDLKKLKNESSTQRSQQENYLKKNIFPQKVSRKKSSICRKTFLNRSNLCRHLTSLLPSTYVFICNICGKTFLFKKSFRQHLSIAHLKYLKERKEHLDQNNRKSKFNHQDNDKHMCDDGSTSKTVESNVNSKFQNCDLSNNMGGRDSKKTHHLLRSDLCVRYCNLRTYNEYHKHRIRLNYNATISQKSKKLKILKNSDTATKNKRTELAELIGLPEKCKARTCLSEENQPTEQLKDSITNVAVNLGTPTILDDKHVESNGVHGKKQVLKKYLPCTSKLKSHQDHSYGKISLVPLNVISDTNGTTSNTFPEIESGVSRVATPVINHSRVDSILVSNNIRKQEMHKIDVDTDADSTKQVNLLFNTLKENSHELSQKKGIILHSGNDSLRNDTLHKQSVKLTGSSNSIQESSKKDVKVKRKVKKILAVCFMCKEVYSLMHHLRIKQIATQNNGPAIGCPFCKQNYLSLAHLERHITSTHLECEGKTKAGKRFVVEIIHPDKPVNYQNNEELAFECHCCPRRFSNLETFNSHVRNFHTRANTEHARTTVSTLAKIKEILSSEIVETIFGKDSDTIEDNLKQGPRVKTNFKDEKVEDTDFAPNRDTHPSNQQSENNSMCSIELGENKVTKHAYDKKDVLDKLICDLGIQSSGKTENLYSFICKICSKRFEFESELICHTEIHVGNVKQKSGESQEKNNEICQEKQDLFQSRCHSLTERWSPTKLRVYTRKPKKVMPISSAVTNINNNNIHAGADEASNVVVTKGKTLFEADSTISGDTNGVTLSEESKPVVKRKKDTSTSSFTKKRKEFVTHTGVSEIERKDEHEDKLVTSTTQGSSCILSRERYPPKKDCKKQSLSRSFQRKPIRNNNKCLQNYEAQIPEKLPKVSNNDTQSTIIQKPVTAQQTKEELIKKTKLWHCRPCRGNFKLIADLIRHKYYYHNDDSVVHICENCTNVLTSVAMVNTHTCTNVKCWSCKRCNLKFPSGILLRQHNTERHYENVGPHICSTCKKNFLTMSMLERHILTTHSHQKVQYPLLSTSRTFRNVNRPTNSRAETLRAEAPPGNIVCQNEDSISDEVPGLERTLWLHHLKKTSLQDCEVVTISRLTTSGKEQFKCNLCESVHHTKLGIKLHLIKQHKTSVDICSLCSKLYIAESIAQHLMNEHMTSEESSAEHANLQSTQKENHTDFVKVLGPKQLYSLCEYRKLGSPKKNKCFKCTMCYREFLNFRFCRTHYFKIHDIVCVLCNKEFVDSRQATDHKLRVHGPVSSYLWAVQKIFAVVLESRKYGKTVQEVINQLTNKVSKRCTATLSKTRTIMENGQYGERLRIRKADSLRDGNRYNRMLQTAEVAGSRTFRKNHDNSPECTLKESKISAARTINVQIEDKHQMEFTNSEENDSCGNAFVLMVTEDDLKLYRNNIKELVSRLCLPSKVFSEDYVTELLLNYVQQIGP